MPVRLTAVAENRALYRELILGALTDGPLPARIIHLRIAETYEQRTARRCLAAGLIRQLRRLEAAEELVMLNAAGGGVLFAIKGLAQASPAPESLRQQTFMLDELTLEGAAGGG